MKKELFTKIGERLLFDIDDIHIDFWLRLRHYILRYSY